MMCPRDGGLLKLYPDSSTSFYASRSSLSLVRTISRLLSSWSKPLEEVATLGRGALVILLTGSTTIFLEDGLIELVSKEFWVCKRKFHA